MFEAVYLQTNLFSAEFDKKRSSPLFEGSHEKSINSLYFHDRNLKVNDFKSYKLSFLYLGCLETTIKNLGNLIILTKSSLKISYRNKKTLWRPMRIKMPINLFLSIFSGKTF